MKSKTVKINKTLRGRMNFKGRLLKISIEINTKSIKNKGAKKTAQKPLQKSILGCMLASKTPAKSMKNRIKNDVKKRFEKISKKTLNTNLS